MKDGLIGFFGTVAICTAVVGVIFGFLGGLTSIDFMLTIAYFAGAILVLSIFAIVVVCLFSFDLSEMPFIKITFAGALLAVLSYLIYDIFYWQIFYTVFVICAFVAGFVAALGIIKGLFFN